MEELFIYLEEEILEHHMRLGNTQLFLRKIQINKTRSKGGGHWRAHATSEVKKYCWANMNNQILSSWVV